MYRGGGTSRVAGQAFPRAVGFFFGNTELSLELWTISLTYRIVSQSWFRLCSEGTENVHGEKRLEMCSGKGA